VHFSRSRFVAFSDKWFRADFTSTSDAITTPASRRPE
jgi:hypothetical protein